MRVDYLIGGIFAVMLATILCMSLILMLFGIFFGIVGTGLIILGLAMNPPQPKQTYQEGIKYCMSCGLQNPKTAQFCNRCGIKFPLEVKP